MNWPLIITIVFELLAIYYTYTDYRAGKVTKRLFTILLAFGSLAVIVAGIMLIREMLVG